MYYLFPDIDTHISDQYFLKINTFVVLKVLLKIKWIFVIFLSLFVIRKFSGTCSSVKMLRGFIFRESLATLAYSIVD